MPLKKTVLLVEVLKLGLLIVIVTWFYEADPFPLLQCFWPDKENRLPWEDSCNEYVRRVQPLLFDQTAVND